MAAVSTAPTAPPPATAGRLAAVQEMARLQRVLFEVEREFLRTVTTIIYRVGEPELKYLLCQHAWESAGHARFLRERGRELTGFGTGEDVRPAIRAVFEEAIRPTDGLVALAGFHRVLKPALLAAYRHYLAVTNPLADWPSRHLVEEFIVDEERHARELAPFLPVAGLAEAGSATHPHPTIPGAATPAAATGETQPPVASGAEDWCAHLAAALAALGGWLGESPAVPLPAGFVWQHLRAAYTHPPTCQRGRFPTCGSVFGHNPAADPIVRPWLEDPRTDARVIRLMVYVWLMMEMDAVDYLATVFHDTPHAPFDLHHDLARHLWDESRHSAFGYRQLPRLGVDLMTLEHSLELYQVLVRMAPHERYAMMTMEFEAGSFATKAHVMDRIRELNDFEADTLLAFDRNDEQNHVRYGHHWLPVMMGLFGESRPVEEFVRATREKFHALAAALGPTIPHTLPPATRLTGEKLRTLALAS
jgi:rubrerythrin